MALMKRILFIFFNPSCAVRSVKKFYTLNLPVSTAGPLSIPGDFLRFCGGLAVCGTVFFLLHNPFIFFRYYGPVVPGGQ